MENNEISSPKLLNDFFGQDDNISVLKTAVSVAKSKKSCIDHTLIFGAAGLGKTTLANIIANELESDFIYVSAPSISKTTELVSIISNIKDNDVLFIDEIHRLSTKLEEILYTVMENFKLCFVFNNEENSKSIVIDIPKFTLVAATTMPHLISVPLRNRFPISIKLEDYSIENIEVLARNMLKELDLSADSVALNLIAKSSRKNPRILKNNIKRIQDFALLNDIKTLDEFAIRHVLKQLHIYDDGLSKIDLEILTCMYYRFNNKPVSLESVSLMIGESKNSLQYMYEPYLVESGYVLRTKRGRILSEKAINYLKTKNIK